jgi:putative ABC transport system permease protein
MLRGQPSRAWLFAFCIAVGVSARVSVGSFLASLDQALALESRSLLTADLEVASGSPLSPAQEALLKAQLPAGTQRVDRISLLTMAASLPSKGQKSGRSRLVQLGAVGPGYPLAGHLTVIGAQGQTLDGQALQGKPWAFVQSDLLTQLGLKLGDPVRVGDRQLVLAGLIVDEPGLGAGAFSLGPRMLIGLDQARATGLTGFGSRVSYEALFGIPDPLQGEALAKAVKQALGVKDRPRFRGMAPARDSLSVRGTKDAAQEIRRFFERLADFLNLVSLMALLLGGIGVASVTRGFVRESAVQLGVLRSLGASPATVTALFAWQAAWLGLLGGFLGSGAGILLQFSLPRLLADFLPLALKAAFSPASLAWGLGLGLFSALLFGVEPALVAESQSTAALLRDEEAGSRLPWPVWALRVGGALAFAGLAALEARSWTRGPGFFGALLLGALVLQGLAALVLPRLARLRSLPLPFAGRQALANLGRPGLRAGATVVALGSAALLLGVLAVYQFSLLSELDPGRKGSPIPDLFMLDIQADQVEPLSAQILAYHPGVKVEMSPMVRARYRGKLGEAEPLSAPAEALVTREKEDEDHMRSREQNLSWRSALGPGEKIVQGRWMDVDGQEVEASVEEWYAQQLHAKLGDILRFDVQGVEVQARVTSLRTVDWGSFRPNFFILISPWALKDAPQTWVGSVSGVGGAQQRGDLQAAISARFSNLTLFDMALGMQKILNILNKIAAAIRLVAGFCLATGLVVLAGLGLATARSRRGEAALLKVLGAGRGQLLAGVGLEFGLLSALASIFGLGLALAFGWVLMVKVIELPFAVPWLPLAQLGLVFTLTGAGVGLLSSWRVFQAKPADVLRED